jgi:hypothetical protein
MKSELYAQLLNSIEQKFDQNKGQAMPFWEWVEKTPIILDGQPFTFNRHEYLREPYQDNHTHVVELKAAQMGPDQ